VGSNLYIGASGAMSRLRQLEIVANNLANSDSVGFKADRVLFHTALEAAVGPGEDGPVDGAPGGVYVETGAVRPDLSRGAVRTTGAPLDAAIDGAGFFVVETPEGERFTRAGSFVVGPDGELSTPSGLRVLGPSGPITVTQPGTRIHANGELVDAQGRRVGSLRIAAFENPAALEKQGTGLFRAPEGVAPEDVDEPSLLEGSLEESNVKPVVELAALMTLQRAFDAAMQSMQAEDSATERLIQEISR